MIDDAPEPDGLYVYALAPDAARAHPTGTGVDGLPLRVVRADGILAVVHDHRGGPFAGSPEQVRRRVLEHDAVVERLWAADRRVLPMSFDVIVRSGDGDPADARLQRWLETATDDIGARFRELDGAVELRIDIALDQHAAAMHDPAVAAARAESDAATAGVQRLMRKRLRRLERDVAERVAGQLYPGARSRLARLSADLVENARAEAADDEVLVLSVAVLARESAVDRIGSELAALAAEQDAVRIRYLGPWPPYSFAALRPSASDTIAADVSTSAGSR